MNGYILREGQTLYFTFDEIEERSNIDFTLKNPTDDYSNMIETEVDFEIRNNDKFQSSFINSGNPLTVEGYSRKPIRNKRRGKTVYHYTIGLK